MRRDPRGVRAMVMMVPAVLLASCEQAAQETPTAKVPVAPPSAAASGGLPVQDTGATPMAERVALIGILNKRNNVAEDIELKPGETREIGPVTVSLAACERTAPWELPQEVGAFVQVDIREREGAAPARVFSGWLFRESPSLNVVEHPIYDVWVKNCTMAFPGDEAAPPRPAPKPAASPAPAPSARATPAPAPAGAPTRG